MFASIIEREDIPAAAKLDLIDSISGIFDDVVTEDIWELAQPKKPHPEAELAREYLKRHKKKPKAQAIPKP